MRRWSDLRYHCRHIRQYVTQITQQARIGSARLLRGVDQFIEVLDQGIEVGIVAAPFRIALFRPRSEADEQRKTNKRNQKIFHGIKKRVIRSRGKGGN
jgi:hypothetical protein